jgi:UDP-N-acetylmuramoylalanine--D-glutamate ligase
VTYVDDSFSTTPETAIAAIKSFDQPKILILGGSHKGSDYSELAKVVASAQVREVISIGDTANDIAAALRQNHFNAITTGPGTMTKIVQAAMDNAHPGDVVLLSPGCASFGLFKNYKDRGEQFQQAVRAL